jgi:uncharacterized protein (DUF305 family)
MIRHAPAAVMTALLVSVHAAGCSSATGGGQGQPPLLGAPPAAAARPSHSAADVHFMSGMIPHHAQAVKMAAWVSARSARPDVRVLAERMLVAQADEIELMQWWLRDRNEPVPAADATHMRMSHGGMVHDMLMPGMLSDAELAQLERAQGTAFDRLFLSFMIRHHEGAIIMIDELFGSEGAAQDDFVFKFASDMYADQTTEIHFMRRILAELPSGQSP